MTRPLAELAVIVVGVLIALAADSAWEARGDRQREAQLLADLLLEFRENEARLEADIESNRTYREATREAVAAVVHSLAIPQDSMATLLSLSLRVTRFDPVEGAIRSLIDAGQLQLIRNRELREALAGWPGLVDERRRGTEYAARVLASVTPDILRLEPDRPLATHELAVLNTMERFGESRVTLLEILLEELHLILQLLEAEVVAVSAAS